MLSEQYSPAAAPTATVVCKPPLFRIRKSPCLGAEGAAPVRMITNQKQLGTI
jgi:hypothetical protein